ncbi:helix-turn-helix domain-containing protein [Streptomyces niveus]
MGRRENAVVADTRQSDALALWLRSQRERRGVTYAAMAKIINHRFSRSMLSRGASGSRVSRGLVLAYAQACGADTGEALRLWKAAQRAEEERRRRAGASVEFGDLAKRVRSVLTHPKAIDTFGKLHEAMTELRAREGQPSLRDLQIAAGRIPDSRRHRLPKSSLSVILRGEAVPSRAHLTAFLEALKVPSRSVRLWEEAWDRITDSHARKPPAAVEFKIVALSSSPVETEEEDPGGTLGTEELDFLKKEVLFATISPVELPDTPRGPQLANPAVSYTRSGLPIRRPRRYTWFTRQHKPRSGPDWGAIPPEPPRPPSGRSTTVRGQMRTSARRPSASGCRPV